MPRRPTRSRKTGKLKIGDDWNAITIIALSQNNPLKAVAEFVENSIDAGARRIVITRGRQRGEAYLRVSDDGEGVPRDKTGIPNFHYVATHICDSIKRRLKARGNEEIQGEFGIGLLSFWTVGESLTLTCSGSDGGTYRMFMKKGDPSYKVGKSRRLFPIAGTELTVAPLLPGIRQFSGEKIQWYLASELRDRIRRTGVEIRVVDRTARKEFRVEPRKFDGQLLQNLPPVITPRGEVYVELYLCEPGGDQRVGLYRRGTRVLSDLAEIGAFGEGPWRSGRIQGLIDAPFLSLTPGTRTGVIQDAAFAELRAALRSLEQRLEALIEEQQRAEEDRASRAMLKTIRKAFQEALLALPPEEYDWFGLPGRPGGGKRLEADGAPIVLKDTSQSVSAEELEGDGEPGEAANQRQFFEYPGPLYSVRISPSSSVMPVNETKAFRALARDRSRRPVEENLRFWWEIIEGEGELENANGEIAVFQASETPGLVRLKVTARQYATACAHEALITVTDSLLDPPRKSESGKQGLPGYTFRKASGELWRSRYDAENNLIVINSGHRDFVYASRKKARKLRYLVRLFVKELVLHNFPGYSGDRLLERMVELSLYTEESLR